VPARTIAMAMIVDYRRSRAKRPDMLSRLRGEPLVPVVQTAGHWKGDDLADAGRPPRPMLRRILVEAKGC